MSCPDDLSIKKVYILEDRHGRVQPAQLQRFEIMLLHVTSLAVKLPREQMTNMPPDTSAYWKIIFLIFSFLNQNIRCGYSKEPSR